MQLMTPPLPPKVVQTLNLFGIQDVENLKEMGACAAFILLKKSGLSVTQHTFRQLVLLCEDESMVWDEERWQYWQRRLKMHPPVALFPEISCMEYFMGEALEMAKLGALMGEVPIGEVVVYQNQIIAKAHNRCIIDCNISHHAEIQALAMAGQYLQNYRLEQCDVYITLEPCAMCASALIQARVARVIYGASEPKTGAAGSVLNLFENKQLNHHTAVRSGVLANQSRCVLQQFFQNKRNGR